MRRISYARHQFPPAVIYRSVWLYFRFSLSFRDVEDMLAEREGEGPEVLARSRRNKRAALKLMQKLLKRQRCIPDQIVSDKLGSYSAALRDLPALVQSSVRSIQQEQLTGNAKRRCNRCVSIAGSKLEL